MNKIRHISRRLSRVRRSSTVDNENATNRIIAAPENKDIDRIREDNKIDASSFLFSKSKINLEGATWTRKVITADSKVTALTRRPNREKSSGAMVAINSGNRAKLVSR